MRNKKRKTNEECVFVGFVFSLDFGYKSVKTKINLK